MIPGHAYFGALLSVFVRCELAALDIARVDFRKVLPFLGQIILGENRRNWADGHARAAVYALDRIDVRQILWGLRRRRRPLFTRTVSRANSVVEECPW